MVIAYESCDHFFMLVTCVEKSTWFGWNTRFLWFFLLSKSEFTLNNNQISQEIIYSINKIFLYVLDCTSMKIFSYINIRKQRYETFLIFNHFIIAFL